VSRDFLDRPVAGASVVPVRQWYWVAIMAPVTIPTKPPIKYQLLGLAGRMPT